MSRADTEAKNSITTYVDAKVQYFIYTLSFMLLLSLYIS